jgi:hypothetical protein
MSTEMFAITKMSPGTPIVADFDEVDKRIAEVVEMYSGAIVTPDKESYSQAKKDRAYLNSLVKSVEQRRIEVKKAYLAPYEAFEALVKDKLSTVRDASADTDRQIKAIEETWRADKRDELEEHYEAYAGMLAEIVPFERVFDVDWLKQSVQAARAKERIEQIVDAIAKYYATLEGLELAHPVEAKATYLETFSLTDAIERSKAIEERLAAVREIEAERAAQAARRPEPEPELAHGQPEPESEPEQERAPEVSEYTFRVSCTDAQLDSIVAHLRSMGLTGTFRRES